MDTQLKELKSILETIFAHLDIDPDFTIEDDSESNTLNVKIWKGDLSFLIGYRGSCLRALQHFLGLALNKNLETTSEDWVRVTVDIEGYMDRRREKLESMTRSYIDKVRFFTEDVHMPHMNSAERYIVHSYVSNYPDIVSESEGEGFQRHIVLKLAKKASKTAED